MRALRRAVKNVLAWVTYGGGSGMKFFKNNFISTWNRV